MKITLLNTYLGGGAGIASRRLLRALTKAGITARLIVQDKASEDPGVVSVTGTASKNFLAKCRLAKEILNFKFHEKNKEDRFQFSTGISGLDITSHPFIKDADLIHLHWINQGFLSLESLGKLFSSPKPVVWTLHDMWAFTGGCHYSGECLRYLEHCAYCPYLRDPSPSDLSFNVWNRKFELYKKSNITFVTCSNWLKELAAQSALLQHFRIEAIPNPIDTDAFSPLAKDRCREKFNLPADKKLVLFGAMNIQDKRKGLEYLVDALRYLASSAPDLIDEIEMVTFGNASACIENIPFKIHHLGSLSGIENLASAYSAADVFVLPSVQDNLPNTVMESMSCGTPVVAFRTGGVPEMIDHLENGYLAHYKSPESLAEGIEYCLSKSLWIAARNKILGQFTENMVAEKYKELYHDLL